MAVEKEKNRSLKTFFFIGALVAVFVLLTIIMVKTSSQKNTINSQASELKANPSCIARCVAKGLKNNYDGEISSCEKACVYDAGVVRCAIGCMTKPLGTQRSNCFKTCLGGE